MSLLKYNWQISTNEKNISSLSKYDNTEISLHLVKENNDCKPEDEVDVDIIKMNYYEFIEIFNELKKVDNQLQVFK